MYMYGGGKCLIFSPKCPRLIFGNEYQLRIYLRHTCIALFPGSMHTLSKPSKMASTCPDHMLYTYYMQLPGFPLTIGLYLVTQYLNPPMECWQGKPRNVVILPHSLSPSTLLQAGASPGCSQFNTHSTPMRKEHLQVFFPSQYSITLLTSLHTYFA